MARFGPVYRRFRAALVNDTGSAIGTGVDAQLLLSGNAKLDWDVYRGAPFVDDADALHRTSLGAFRRQAFDYVGLAERLATGAILGWVSERTELGPRALGNRSILAAPFSKNTLKRLNDIKQREPFRPIAPICLEEDVHTHFDLQRPSPHMLYFAKVKTDALQAVTHVDGSARVQTVNRDQNAPITELLRAFRHRTGFGVLCNTSLNFHGSGFINRTSDLVRYSEQAGLDGFVVQGQLFMRDDEHRGAGG
ncbi:carbamoyltransferase C-terminal domain-containing protein [Pandoraea sputorum]|uniref:carbamoyltransferase C-terminal domain-containing protein n=1 Tax=Pandoraea sputorum TaxID=93222 RepID=UPI0012520450|nr:carbamoyltransferase C-terminal domain-containing protein [Pandoraea sputorum]VVE59555.1 3'-hydroxymethylcephem-O-carbamoyltransferase [Pandoraea sputorum]